MVLSSKPFCELAFTELLLFERMGEGEFGHPTMLKEA